MKRMKQAARRVLATVLTVAVLLVGLPAITRIATGTAGSALRAVSLNTVTDPGTAHMWETMMGTDVDGNRYAGRVWVDKSVYTNGQTVVLNTSGTNGSSFVADLGQDEAFQIVFSALGSSMTTTTTTSSSAPLDVVLVLDSSGSMRSTSGGVTRMQRTIEASNKLIGDLLSVSSTRLGIVSYNEDSDQVIPLAHYTNGVTLSVNSYTNSSTGGVITAKDKDGKTLGADDGYESGTNLQSGIDRGMKLLSNATNVAGRKPVIIILTDGDANHAVRNNWYNVSAGTVVNSSGSDMVLSTMLNAAYNKVLIEKNYNTEAMVYSVSVDLGTSSVGNALMNPAHSTRGFNGRNTSGTISGAWDDFEDWARGNTVTNGNGNNRWTFDHNYTGATRQEIVDNIVYVDEPFEVSSPDLEVTFDQIYEELSSGVFNPISSSTKVDGATGVQNTPLIYVDDIGRYMEIKEIQSVLLFGRSYGVSKNADGSYTVNAATGYNPTTGEAWNTAEDIRISVEANADGSQRLEIRINQEILPILLEQVSDKTVGGVHSVTLAELGQSPLRVFYTVGVASNVLLPNGEIDVREIAADYHGLDKQNGTVTLYSNAFGVRNAPENGVVAMGDAHVGFKPAAANRYYYHQTNQGIFTDVRTTDNSQISWEANEYGVLYQKDKFDLTWMTYADYAALQPTDRVYTYVTYYRPTPATNDAATAAEKVTYLVYTDWGYLKESVAFYDHNAGVYVNYDEMAGYVTADVGYAIDQDDVAATLSAYTADNRNAQLYAVLGVESLRTSRLHNMRVNKAANDTDTATLAFAPEYIHKKAADHHDNDVVVWLGNNGRVTLDIATGIALTKQVTEAIGGAEDIYDLTVTVPDGVVATPSVHDVNGNQRPFVYKNNVLTVALKAGETAYISGIPAGAECAIGEVISGDYYIASKTATVTVPSVEEALSGRPQYVTATVTNAPNKYGNLYITKEMESDHTIPADVLDEEFTVVVNVGTALAGNTYTVKDSASSNDYNVTVAADGTITLAVKARGTLEILGLPAGTVATVTEQMTAAQDAIFDVAYRTRNHTGEDADTNNELVIPADYAATAVITNTYTPLPVEVDLDIAGTKEFTVEDPSVLPAGAFNFKVQRWNGTEWEDIGGKVAQTPYAAGESGNKTFIIENVLEGVKFNTVGSWAYQVLEVKGNVENVTYDRTLYTFTVTVKDEAGSLVATVTDLNNTEITDGSYEVTFRNTYHTAPVSIDIEKQVNNLSGDIAVSKAGFRFTAVQTNANWEKLPNTAPLTVYSNAVGAARMAATYTAAGTYYYLLTEENTAAPGWTYSTAQYRVTVTVTQEGGNLTAAMSIAAVNGTAAADEIATVNGTNGKVVFKNTYNPDDATVDLTAEAAVNKVLVGKTLTAGMFSFAVYENNTDNVVLNGTNDASGKVVFEDVLTFDSVGKYEYDVREILPVGAQNATYKGMTYDDTVYDLVVEVTNDVATGALVAVYYFEDSTEDFVTFHNTYAATPTTYTIGGYKDVIGRAVKAGEFTFELWEGNTTLEEVAVKADGTFTFGTIRYTEAGDYTYTVKEVAGNVPGIVYTGVNAPITVTVTVTDTDGVLSATANVKNAAIRFENAYVPAEAKVTFGGTKTLVGGTFKDGDFTFSLYKTDHTFNVNGLTPLASVSNVDDVFAFEAIKYNTTGIYHYVLVENADDPIDGIVYDRTAYQFRVQVNDIGDGQLRAIVENVLAGTVTAPAAETTVGVEFINATFEEVTEKEVYLDGNTATMIDGQKVDAGDVLTYYITYVNYNGEDAVVDIVDVIPAYTTYVENSATHNGVYAGGRVGWILNVPAGEEVTVSFQVTVDTTDAILANTAVVRDGVNVYTTNEVVNHTVEDEGKKDVFNATDVETSVDGGYVFAGEELVYTITYVNPTNEKVTVNITDTIPQNTTYVQGSANRGGAMVNGVLTWADLEVAAWSSVTVSFSVTVNAVDDVTIRNTAVVEGENTNTVTVTVPKYTPYEMELPVNKTLDGRDLAEGEFTFELKDAAGNVIDTVKNGNAAMLGTAIMAEGDYTFTVSEVNDGKGGVTYDTTVYTVTLKVVHNGAGALVLDGDVVITVDGETVNAIAFKNTYKAAPYELILTGEKELVGRDMVDGEFEFVLFTENGGGLDKVANQGGKFTFAPIEITAAGTYVYRVTEAAGDDATVTYDDTVYTVTVKVADNGEGELVLDGEMVIAGGEELVFTNTYTAPPAEEPPVEEPPVEEPPVEEPPVEEPPVETPPVDTGDVGYTRTVAMMAMAGGLFVVLLHGGKRRRKDSKA